MFHLQPSTINVTAQEVEEIKALSLKQLKSQCKSNTHGNNQSSYNGLNGLNLTSYLSEDEDNNMVVDYEQIENDATSPSVPKTTEKQ